MSCEKYSGWLTDTALGELRAEREPELLAHAIECEACRDALSHAREVHQFMDRGVESLVAGEPSPRFAANLRRRIAQESGPLRSPWATWAPIIAGALALAVVLAIMVARKTVTTGSNPNVAVAVNPVSAPPEAVTASATNPPNAERAAPARDPRRACADAPRHKLPSGNHCAARPTCRCSPVERRD